MDSSSPAQSNAAATATPAGDQKTPPAVSPAPQSVSNASLTGSNPTAQSNSGGGGGAPSSQPSGASTTGVTTTTTTTTTTTLVSQTSVGGTAASGGGAMGGGAAASDIRYEVLDLNSHGMFLCQTEHLDEAGKMLTDAYHMLEQDSTISDVQMLDLLKATTLNNLGVVECHKGLHREALNHLEVAQALEHQWHVQSPSICLNLCATYNALGQFDKATKAALETITLLRDLARSQTQQQQQNGGTTDATANPRKPSNPLLHTSNDENQVLWGAAWHNLGIAQINTALQTKKGDPAEHTNVLVIFRNAIKATTDLLGKEHSMAKAVLLTYRAVRTYLRDRGVFKQHAALLTCGLPPVTTSTAFFSTAYPDPDVEPGQTLRSARRQHQTDIRVTIRPDRRSAGGGRNASGSGNVSPVRIVQFHAREAYPPQLVAEANKDALHMTGSVAQTISPRRRNELRGLPVSGLLLHATSLYAWTASSRHRSTPRHRQTVSPRGQQQQNRSNSGGIRQRQRKQQQQVMGSLVHNSHGNQQQQQQQQQSSGAAYLPPIEYTPRRQYKQQQQQQQRGGGGGGLKGIADPTAYHVRDAHDVTSDMAMWVETSDMSPLRPHASRAVRPAYAQQIYLVDDNDRVAQPSYLAHKDVDTAATPSSAGNLRTASGGGSSGGPVLQPRPPSGPQQRTASGGAGNSSGRIGRTAVPGQSSGGAKADVDHYPNLHAIAKAAQ